jgi:cold shock CspA family protein
VPGSKAGRSGRSVSNSSSVKAFPDADGREIYFHRNAVLAGHFDRLRIGSQVRFAEEAGEKGPQASSVRLVRSTRQGRRAAASALLPVAHRGGAAS